MVVFFIVVDVGNRITELNKVVGHLRGDMKQIYQTLLNMDQIKQDPSSESSSSVIGKYIKGAKNNFRDFNGGLSTESKKAPLLVNIHPSQDDAANEGKEQNPGDKGQVKEEADIKKEEQMMVNTTEMETEKMEEGRANEATEASLTGSGDSQDTGFESQESDLSLGSPETEQPF